MTATEALKHEHKIILMVIDAVGRESDRINATGQIRTERIDKMLDFIRNFADRCHHSKEEGILFKKMNDKGMPADSGPIAVMLKEHEKGRSSVKVIADAIPKAAAGDASATAVIRDNLLAYARLLKEHIYKEDNVLYPMADKMFTSEDQQSLNDAFEKVAAEELGEGVHEKYHQVAHNLAKS